MNPQQSTKKQVPLVEMMFFLLIVSVSIMNTNASGRRGSWGTNTQSLGWAIDNNNNRGVRSTTNSYHMISASRSGFKLYDENPSPSTRGGDEDNKNGATTQLVSCTRYGQRVKKPKSKDAHGHQSSSTQTNSH